MLLSFIVLLTVVAVIVAMFSMLWRERRSSSDAAIAVLCGLALVAWAAVAFVVARRGGFVASSTDAVPPIGRALGLALLVMAGVVAISPSLRRMLSSQRFLLRLNLWRLLGVLFFTLMFVGQLPAVFAVPAGTGDILIGATAFWIASGVGTAAGRRPAIVFTLLGMLDLVVAVTLGMMTTPGPTFVLHGVPTGEVLTQFPMALVPAFLVPLAFALHVVSLWQLVRGSWAGESRAVLRPSMS
jgi:hypothetical protein